MEALDADGRACNDATDRGVSPDYWDEAGEVMV